MAFGPLSARNRRNKCPSGMEARVNNRLTVRSLQETYAARGKTRATGSWTENVQG